MRDSSSILSAFKDKESKLLLRFSKNRTIKLSESDDSSSGEEKRGKLDSSDSEDVTEKPPNPMMESIKKSLISQIRVKTNIKKNAIEGKISFRGGKQNFQRPVSELDTSNTHVPIKASVRKTNGKIGP